MAKLGLREKKEFESISYVEKDAIFWAVTEEEFPFRIQFQWHV